MLIRSTKRVSFLALAMPAFLALLWTGLKPFSATDAAVPTVPRANDQQLLLNARHRVPDLSSSSQYRVEEKPIEWQASRTALIIVDMWDKHWCQGASDRVAELAPRMNRFVAAARDKGVLVVHAPSSCMEPYKDHPARHRAQNAPKAGDLPPEIASWCKQIPTEEKGK